jgi:hypothetical protein
MPKAPMTPMTQHDLLQAVTEIAKSSDSPVVTGPMIKAWCSRNDIDWGANAKPTGIHFWNADLANAPKVLRKFKQECKKVPPSGLPVAARSPNGWCLIKDWTAACNWTAAQTPPWRAVPWDSERANWIWRCAARVGAGSLLATFDQTTLAGCPFWTPLSEQRSMRTMIRSDLANLSSGGQGKQAQRK